MQAQTTQVENEAEHDVLIAELARDIEELEESIIRRKRELAGKYNLPLATFEARCGEKAQTLWRLTSAVDACVVFGHPIAVEVGY